jgi:hypothetical protein
MPPSFHDQWIRMISVPFADIHWTEFNLPEKLLPTSNTVCDKDREMDVGIK